MSKLTERLRSHIDCGGGDLYEIEEAVERIEQFVKALDEEMVVSHIGVFNEGDDPRKAIKDLMLWSQGVGEYFANEKNKERIEHLERVLVQAREALKYHARPMLDTRNAIAAIDKALKEKL